MSQDQIDKLARSFADATGISVDVAKVALQDQDGSMVRMAQGVVRVHESKDQWQADMARWRRRILEAA